MFSYLCTWISDPFFKAFIIGNRQYSSIFLSLRGIRRYTREKKNQIPIAWRLFRLDSNSLSESQNNMVIKNACFKEKRRQRDENNSKQTQRRHTHTHTLAIHIHSATFFCNHTTNGSTKSLTKQLTRIDFIENLFSYADMNGNDNIDSSDLLG